jgi:hypothetical protein
MFWSPRKECPRLTKTAKRMESDEQRKSKSGRQANGWGQEEEKRGSGMGKEAQCYRYSILVEREGVNHGPARGLR